MSEYLRPVQAAPAPREAYLEWEQSAACADVDMDPEIFFPDKGGTYTAARRVCLRCPVLGLCQRWNDRVEGDRQVGIYGMYAAEKPEERVARRREERGAAA